TGWKAQWSFAGSETVAAPSVPAESGQGAPILTQVPRSAIARSGSFAFGGILIGPSWRTASISGLASGSPGVTTGPESGPFDRPSRESSRSPAFDCLGPWHD